MMNRRTYLSTAAALVALLSAAPLLAQNKYPAQPVKVIVALPAGGGVDMLARTLGQKLSANLGQPVIVDNKAGGSGQIGMSQVAKAPADGYTITISPLSFLATNKSIFKTLSYDPRADFAPITRLVTQPMVLVVKDKQKYPNAGAFIAAAKANPGKQHASSGMVARSIWWGFCSNLTRAPICSMCPTGVALWPSMICWQGQSIAYLR